MKIKRGKKIWFAILLIVLAISIANGQNNIGADTKIFDTKALSVLDVHGKIINADVQFLGDDIKIKLEEGPIKEIFIKNMRNLNLTFLKIDNVPETTVPGAVEVYAIDISTLNFTNATVTAIAKGNVLYKCKTWNFTARECEDPCNGTKCELERWKKIMDITPGKDYTFILTPEDPGFAEYKTKNVSDFWPMFPGNYWLFENENGTDSFLFKIEKCDITENCFALVKTDFLNNITVINYVAFEGDTLYKLVTEGNNLNVDYRSNPVPILYTGIGTKVYHGKAEKQRDLDVQLIPGGMLNLSTKAGEFEAYPLHYHTHRSKDGVTIVYANYTIYYVLGIGPVQIDWIDGSVHKLKKYMIK